MPSQLDLTLGAIEVGLIISCMLYGAVTVQLYTYSQRCQNDPLWLISLVIGVWLLETVHTVLSVAYVYDGTITNFGNPLSVTNAPWTLDVSVTFQALVGVSVQSFFAYRVWKVSKSLIFPSLAWFGSAVRFGVAVSITCLLLKSGNIATYSNDDGWTVVVSLTVSLAVDTLNSAALTWYLSARKSDFQQTSRMVDRIIIYSIETGLVTSFTALTMLITRLAMPHNFVWIGLFQIYAKLYSNSLLVSLNVRSTVKDKYVKEVSMTSSVADGHGPTPNVRRGDRGGISIQMVSFTETGDPGQNLKQDGEEDLDSAHTALDVPYKS